MSTTDNPTPDTDRPADAAADTAAEAPPAAASPSPAAASQPVVGAPQGAPASPGPQDLLAGVRQEMDNLSEAVLDAADLASRSAQAAVSAGTELKSAAGQFRQLSEQSHKVNRILVIAASAVMLLVTLFFLLMGARMVSRINQLDAMLLAVGKRAVELNASLADLETVSRGMADLAAKQDAMAKSTAELQARIDASVKQAESLVQQVPAATAKQVAATGDNLVKQVQGINTRLQTQAKAVETLSGQVGALKGAVSDVDKLNRDVQALITLQRERYLEALQRNNAAAARERAVQYPRVSPPQSRPGTDDAATGPAKAN